MLGPRRDGCHAGVRSRDPPFPPLSLSFFGWHDEGHVPVLLRNANSFVIILIYAPVSRRATHQRRRPTGGGGGGGFVYTLLAFAPEISCFPADCRRLRYAGMPGRETCLEALSGQGERAPRRALLVTCASTEVYIRLPDGMRRYHTRAERLYYTDEKSRLRAYDEASFGWITFVCVRE